jgi:hypothetical protein
MGRPAALWGCLVKTLLEIFRDYRAAGSCFAGEPAVRTYERARRSLLWRAGLGDQMIPFSPAGDDWRILRARSEYFGEAAL